MQAVDQLKDVVGTKQACKALDIARSSYYGAKHTHQHQGAIKTRDPKVQPKPQPRALSPIERRAILDVCDSERFCDVSAATIYATLLDEGVYLGSIATFYRVLGENNQVRERRRIATHPSRIKPELVATSPGETWSWDITKLKGPAKGVWFHLYVVLDIYSRFVVGYRVEAVESGEFATEMMGEAIEKEQVDPTCLTVHADNGSSMASKALSHFLIDLGVTKTHSRPHVSNDNPYSEAQFKTLKYRPNFPEHFESLEAARSFMANFFYWYHYEHRHSGIALMTPADVHYGYAGVITKARRKVLARAYRKPSRALREQSSRAT